MKGSLLLICLLFLTHSFAQESDQQITWAHTLDGYNTTDFTDMDVDSSGNTFVSFMYQGAFSDPELKNQLPDPGYVGGAVVKFDAAGKPLWVIGIKGAWSVVRSILVAKNGDFLITGSCEGITSFPSVSGKVKKLGREKIQNAYHHPQFLFVARYSNEGELKWVKMLETSAFGAGTSIAETAKGELFWAIHFSGKLYDGDELVDEASTGSSNIYKHEIVKLTSTGMLTGFHPFQRISFDENPIYNARLVLDHEDALIVHGLFQKSVAFTPNDSLTNDNYYDSRDAFIVKFDREEKYLWSRKIGGQHYQDISEMRVDKRGNIHVTGHYGYECIISNGIELIQKTKFEYTSGYSFFYAGFSKDGQLDYAQFHSQPGYGGTVMGRAMGIDEKGYAHIFGSYKDTLSFDGKVDPIYGQHDENSVFYSRWKRDSLEVLSQQIISKKGWSNYMDVIIRNGKCYVGGMYYGTNELQDVKGKPFRFSERDYGRSAFVYSFSIPELPEIYEQSDTAAQLLAIYPILQCLPPQLLDQSDIWVLREDRDPTSNQEPVWTGDSNCGVLRDSVFATLFPNPTAQLTTLELKGIGGRVVLQVFSSSGQFLFAQDLMVEDPTQQFELNFSNVTPGTYFIQLQQAEFMKILKLVKM